MRGLFWWVTYPSPDPLLRRSDERRRNKSHHPQPLPDPRKDLTFHPIWCPTGRQRPPSSLRGLQLSLPRNFGFGSLSFIDTLDMSCYGNCTYNECTDTSTSGFRCICIVHIFVARTIGVWSLLVMGRRHLVYQTPSSSFPPDMSTITSRQRG